MGLHSVQTFPKLETLQYRNAASYNSSKGHKHSQSHSFRDWNTFRGKGGKGWNLNLTFLMNSSITILLWQQQLQNSPHLGRGNRKSQVFGALNAQSGSSPAAPPKASRLSLGFAHHLFVPQLQPPFSNQVWQASKWRLPQRGGSWGRAVPTCVGRGPQISCSWRWKNYTRKQNLQWLPIVPP